MATAKKTASRSGNPATRAAASSASDFKKRKQGAVIALPSGLYMTLKRVDLQTFVAQGEIPNSLVPIIMDSLKKGTQPDMSKVVGGPDQSDADLIKDLLDMVSVVVCACALSPRVHPVPEADVERDDELLYLDELDEEDMMFIFQWAVGGTSDLEQFRRELRSDMVTLAEVAGGSSTTE